MLIGLLVIKGGLSLVVKQSASLTAYSNITYLLLLLLATGLAIFNAVQNTQGARSFWVLLAAGYGLWSLDQWLWVYYEVGLHIKIPDSSIADPALFLHIVPFMVALATLPHLDNSNSKVNRTTANFLLLLFLWVFLYAYLLFPYQYLFWNSKVYNFRYNILYLAENLALIVALAVLALRVLPPWRFIYCHLLGASALYALSSAVANFAIDSGGYSYTSLYALAQDAAVCWFVWVPLYAQKLPKAEIRAPQPDARHGKYTSLLPMLAVVGISLIGLWELFRLGDAPGMRSFRLLVVLIFVGFVAFAVFLKEYVANRELVADVQLSNLQWKLSEMALDDSEALKGSILSSLENLIAVINRDGVIIDVNESWTRSGHGTGMPSWSAGVGTNYLENLRGSADRCPEAREVLGIIQAVMDGSVSRLRYDYRCESSPEPRWFALTVTPLRTRDGGVVICFKDITDVRKVEARYGELVDTVRAIVWRVEPSALGTTYVSKQAEEILGYPPERWVKEPSFWKDHIHPEDREWVLAFMAEAVQEKRRHDFECRMIAADGRTVWLHDIVDVVEGNGQPIELVGLSVDITERKQAEEKLKASEERSRKLVQSSSVAMVVSRGLEQKVELMNDKFTALFGYTIEDVPDVDHWWPLAYPDEVYRQAIRNEWQARVETAICNGTDIEPIEATVRCKDGSSRHIEAHLSCMGDTNLVTLVDLTERKRAEEALHRSEERLVLAAQAGKMYAYEWDVATDTIMRSPEYVNILGFSGLPLQPTRHQILDRVHPDDRALLIGSVDQVTPSNPTTQMSYRMLRPDGALIWLETRGRGFFDAHGRLVRMIGMVADITEHKLAEEALASLSGRLIEAQEAERKRIARELHDDYSQRLAMLAIDMEKLADNVGDSSVEAAQQLHEFFDRVGELGADLHSLSHSLHSSTLESLGLTAGVKAFCEEFADQQGIQVDFVHENIPRGIPGDAALCLFRIAQEALRNVKRHSGADRAEVRLEWLGEKLHLSISDQGRGFDSSKLSPDSGIGIRSMEERLRLLGGHLEMHSKPMEGARIDAWLPFKGASKGAS